MNKTGMIIGVLLLILAGGFFVFKGQGLIKRQNGIVQNTSIPSSTGEASPSERVNNVKNTVKYTNNGFMPDTLAVTVGTTVTFINESSGPMWVASNPHPTHTDLSGFDELQSVDRGGSYNYTFQKPGTWKYHNHVNAGDGGMVVVRGY